MVWLIVFAVTIPEILRVEIIKKTALISIRVFFHGYNSRNDSQNSRGRKGTIFYSTLPLPPAHEHPDIYLQLCMWDDYDLFLFATLVFTRLLLDKFYHLIELLFNMSYNFLFVYLICFWVFVTAIWHGKQVDSNSHRLSPLYYKRTEEGWHLVDSGLESSNPYLYLKELNKIFQMHLNILRKLWWFLPP